MILFTITFLYKATTQLNQSVS